MHLSNRLFWEYCRRTYPRYFENVSVLEVGSYNVNGSVRDYFKTPSKYVGVDWRPGPGVDLVSFAHDLKLETQFDVVISASMLEHDRHWEKSLRSMVRFLKEDGILLLSWGAAANKAHDHDTADDGCFHSLAAGRVLQLLPEIGIRVHEFRYEGLQFPKQCMGDGMGEVCLVGFRDTHDPKIGCHLDPLTDADRV